MNKPHAAWACICFSCEPEKKDIFSFLTEEVPEEDKNPVTLAEAEASFYRVELRRARDDKM